MSKSRFLLPAVAAAAIAVSAGVSASPATVTSNCAAGEPAVLVHVAGFKQAKGQVKISVYGSDSSRWLAKKGRIAKVKVPVAGRAMNVCIPVPAPGRYAVAVHHDFNLNGNRDAQDGGGFSRNPKVTLLNPKPAFARAAFNVGNGPARVGVTLLYIKGLGVGPAKS